MVGEVQETLESTGDECLIQPWGIRRVTDLCVMLRNLDLILKGLKLRNDKNWSVTTEKVNSDCSMENGLGAAGLEAGRLVVSLVTIIVILTEVLTVWWKEEGELEGYVLDWLNPFPQQVFLCCCMSDTRWDTVVN